MRLFTCWEKVNWRSNKFGNTVCVKTLYSNSSSWQQPISRFVCAKLFTENFLIKKVFQHANGQKRMFYAYFLSWHFTCKTSLFLDVFDDLANSLYSNFSKAHKISNAYIVANFTFPYICSFICYLRFFSDCDWDLFLLTGHIGVGDVVTVAQCEHFRWVLYNPFIAKEKTHSVNEPYLMLVNVKLEIKEYIKIMFQGYFLVGRADF